MEQIYIATRWTLSAMAEVVDGDAAIERRVMKGYAESPEAFKRQIEIEYLDRPGNSVDDNVWVGPVGVARMPHVR